MDDKVKAVLEAYHARMREEEKVMRAPPATGAGDWRDKVLLAVGPDTGRLINILARSLKAPTILELGDAVQMITELPAGIDFVLVDLWKDLYVPCLDAFYPKLNPGAIIVADNMLRPANDEVKQYARAVRALPGITSVLLSVGSGIEISRYES
jgi:predicted O-methyltransferase YrrM